MNSLNIDIHKYLVLLIPLLLLTGPFFPDLFTSLSGLFFVYFFFFKKKLFNNLIDKNYLYLFLIFNLYLIISTLFSSNIYLSLTSTLFYFRFFVLSLSIWLIINHFKKFIDYLYILLSLILFFLIIDSLIQYFFGKNIFGFYPRSYDRITSIFNQDSILGSYLIRILPIYIACFFLTKVKLNYLFIVNMLFSPVIIILSGERTAVLLYLLLLFLFLIFIKIEYYYKIIFILIISFITSSILLITPNTFDRIYLKTINEIKNLQVYKSDNMQSSFDTNQTHSIRLSLYYNSIKIFNDNRIFGSGPKTFRVECKKYEKKVRILNYDNEEEIHKVGCSTHPHNTYLQLLSETGIFGFFILFLIYVYSIFKLLLIFFNRDKEKISFYNFQVISLLAILINFFPFIPSGNFFNNWLSILYYLPIGFILTKQYD